MKKSVLLTLLLLSGLAAFSQTGICFSVTASPSVSGSPNAVTTADFNSDGIMDVAIANYNGNNVSVLLGTGGGFFAAAVNYTVGGEPSGIVASDFNADGKPDLATSNSQSNNISVLLNTGTGTFGAANNYNSSGTTPQQIVAADFSNDGKSDIAITNSNSNDVSVFLGTGTGSFGAAVSYTVGSQPFAITVAYFNGSNADLAISCMSSGNVYILAGAGNGTFTTYATPYAGNSPKAINANDYNNDGFVDFAVTTSFPNEIQIFLSLGGTFSSSIPYSVNSEGICLSSGDYNSDGNIDLTMSSITSSDVVVFSGSPTGSFNMVVTYPTGTSPYSIASADFNSDGKKDLVSANFGSNSATVFLNVAVPTLTITPTTATAVCNGTAIGMTVSGSATSYTWSTGATTTSVSVTPFFSTTYTVTGASGNGCLNTATQSVTIYAVPTVDVTPTSLTICSGNSATFYSSGNGVSYSWNTGATTTSLSVSPAVTTAYTLTATSANGCTSQATAFVNVNPTPVASATTNTPVCMGGNLNFTNTSTGSGNTYYWTGPDGFISTLSNPSISNLTASQTGTYQLQASSPVGCIGTTTINVTVGILPTLTVTASSPSVCAGSPVTVSGAGAVTYTWMPGAITGANQTYYPLTNATYTVTGSSAAGCESTNTISVSTIALTNITGTVTTSSVPVPGSVILYKYEPFLTKFDSINTLPLSGTGAYTFTSVPEASYIVKAVPSASSLQVTYGNSSISWQNAQINNHGCVTTSTQNINVQPFISVGTGPGSLSGTITQTVGFGQRPASMLSTMAPGQPIGGIVVKGGKNPGGSMFAQTTTGADGTYTLSGLPANTGFDFFIMVDIPGLDTNGTYHRYITTANPQYTQLDFTVDSARVNPVPSNTTGIKTSNAIVSMLNIYPNPATNQVTIQYHLLSETDVRIELTDVLGRRVKLMSENKRQPSKEYVFNEPISEFEAGLYFIRISFNDSEIITKLLITR